MVTRYSDASGLIKKANPSMQRWCASNEELAHLGDFPSLAQLKVFGENTPCLWLIPQLVNLSEFCGARDKLTEGQLEDLAYIIAQKFYFLKISELMLFFFRFKSGQYGRFYGTVDPLIIIQALQEFIKERGRTIDAYERERLRQEYEKATAEAITWEEYQSKYKTNE